VDFVAVLEQVIAFLRQRGRLPYSTLKRHFPLDEAALEDGMYLESTLGCHGGQTHPEMMQGTTESPHQIAGPLLPQAAPVFDAATALHTAVDVLDPQPTLVDLLVRHVLLPRELLPHIAIHSSRL